MRSFLLSTILLLAGASAALAQQDTYSGDAAAAYHWVRANAGPGQCGCFWHEWWRAFWLMELSWFLVCRRGYQRREH